MPITIAFDEELVEYNYQGHVCTFELSNKVIHLYHPTGEQVFLCKVEDLSNKQQLLESFPNRTAILVASQNYIRGRTNKDKFRFAINKLLQQGRITTEQHRGLESFIAEATCPPMKIIEKLVMKGFTDMLSAAEFAEDAPELSFCADVLENYIKELT